MDIRKGDIIKIGKEKYDVLNILEDMDEVDTEKNELIGEHTAIELHKFENASILATHLLKIYYDNDKEGILLKIYYGDIPKKYETPWSRGVVRKEHTEKVVSVDDIKIETTQ